MGKHRGMATFCVGFAFLGVLWVVPNWCAYRGTDISLMAATPGFVTRPSAKFPAFNPPVRVLKNVIAVVARSAPESKESDDRCYYGDVDANGKLIDIAKKQRGPALKPSP